MNFLRQQLFFTNNLLKITVSQILSVRLASKKTGTGSRNPKSKGRPKHRGWRVQDGKYVETGTILVTQRTLKFHPGYNVGFGKNGTLFALIPGTVMVTCEKADLNWDHTWIQRTYDGRMNQSIYKKHFNVIPKPQHTNFNLIEQN